MWKPDSGIVWFSVMIPSIAQIAATHPGLLGAVRQTDNRINDSNGANSAYVFMGDLLLFLTGEHLVFVGEIWMKPLFVEM